MGYKIMGYDIQGQPIMEWAAGAELQAPRMLAPQLAQRLAPQTLMPAGATMQMPPVVVQKREPDNAELTPMAFNTPTTVAITGGTATATATPQELFTPRRLVVPDSIASDFLCNPIFIGTKLMSAANVAMPAEAFRGNVIGSVLKCATAQPNTSITMLVTNNGNVARQFLSVLYGVVVN